VPRGRVACDFFVVVTATFRSLYVFVILELKNRRIPSQRHRSSDGEVDLATIAGGATERPWVSVRDPGPRQHILYGPGPGSDGPRR
jgi:hypothetical protein